MVEQGPQPETAPQKHLPDSVLGMLLGVTIAATAVLTGVRYYGNADVDALIAQQTTPTTPKNGIVKMTVGKKHPGETLEEHAERLRAERSTIDLRNPLATSAGREATAAAVGGIIFLASAGVSVARSRKEKDPLDPPTL